MPKFIGVKERQNIQKLGQFPQLNLVLHTPGLDCLLKEIRLNFRLRSKKVLEDGLQNYEIKKTSSMECKTSGDFYSKFSNYVDHCV